MPKTCSQFAKDGSCTFGSECKYLHLADRKDSSKEERAEELKRVEKLRIGIKQTIQAPSNETHTESVQKDSIEQKDAVANYFSKYPTFCYNQHVMSITNFYRLCDHCGWNKHNALRKKASEGFKTALVLQFNGLYGIDADDSHS